METPNPSLFNPIFLNHIFSLLQNYQTQTLLHTLNNNSTRRLSLTIITCSKLKTKKSRTRTDKNVSKKILLSNSAPPVVSEEISGGGVGGKKVPEKEKSRALGFLKRLPRKVSSVLSILPLAIGEILVIAVLMAPGM